MAQYNQNQGPPPPPPVGHQFQGGFPSGAFPARAFNPEMNYIPGWTQSNQVLGGMPADKLKSVKNDFRVPTSYKGYVLRKADPASKNELKSWSRSIRSDMAFDQPDLEQMCKSRLDKVKKPALDEYNELKIDQRSQVDRILMEARGKETHPCAEWVLAMIRKERKESRGTFTRTMETTAIHIILKRQDKTERTQKVEVSKKDGKDGKVDKQAKGTKDNKDGKDDKGGKVKDKPAVRDGQVVVDLNEPTDTKKEDKLTGGGKAKGQDKAFADDNDPIVGIYEGDNLVPRSKPTVIHQQQPIFIPQQQGPSVYPQGAVGDGGFGQQPNMGAPRPQQSNNPNVQRNQPMVEVLPQGAPVGPQQRPQAQQERRFTLPMRPPPVDTKVTNPFDQRYQAKDVPLGREDILRTPPSARAPNDVRPAYNRRSSSGKLPDPHGARRDSAFLPGRRSPPMHADEKVHRWQPDNRSPSPSSSYDTDYSDSEYTGPSTNTSYSPRSSKAFFTEGDRNKSYYYRNGVRIETGRTPARPAAERHNSARYGSEREREREKQQPRRPSLVSRRSRGASHGRAGSTSARSAGSAGASVAEILEVYKKGMADGRERSRHEY